MSSLRKNEFEDVPLHVIHLDQDDPKKCSARRLAKNGHAILHKSTRAAPEEGVSFRSIKWDFDGAR